MVKTERQKLATKKWRERNKDKTKIYMREYRKRNREKITNWHREYWRQNRERIAPSERRYRQRNRDKILARMREYHKREDVKARIREWKKRNPDKCKDVIRQALSKLKNKPCLDCGQSFPPCVMDFDHVRGEKAFNVGSRTSLPLMMAEIEKCELVCANCHRIRTHERRKKK